MSSRMCNKLIVLALIAGAVFVSCNSNSGSEAQVNAAPEQNHEEIQNDAHPMEPSFDGAYCAEVRYYNPNTGTRSNYSLVVEADKGNLIKIQWPDGGHLDTDHFVPAPIGADSIAVIESDKGSSYTVHLIGKEEDCHAKFATRVQCKGITKSGNRCKRMTDNSNGYCFQHQP